MLELNRILDFGAQILSLNDSKSVDMFSTRIAETITSDFRIFALTVPIDYNSIAGVHYRLPRGAQSDLASIPRELWSLLPPQGCNGAEYGMAALGHDCAYRNTLQVVNLDGTVMPANLVKQDCDLLLKEMMIACQVPSDIVEIIYAGVVTAGQHAFDNDR